MKMLDYAVIDTVNVKIEKTRDDYAKLRIEGIGQIEDWYNVDAVPQVQQLIKKWRDNLLIAPYSYNGRYLGYQKSKWTRIVHLDGRALVVHDVLYTLANRLGVQLVEALGLTIGAKKIDKQATISNYRYAKRVEKRENKARLTDIAVKKSIKRNRSKTNDQRLFNMIARDYSVGFAKFYMSSVYGDIYRRNLKCEYHEYLIDKYDYSYKKARTLRKVRPLKGDTTDYSVGHNISYIKMLNTHFSMSNSKVNVHYHGEIFSIIINTVGNKKLVNGLIKNARALRGLDLPQSKSRAFYKEKYARRLARRAGKVAYEKAYKKAMRGGI